VHLHTVLGGRTMHHSLANFPQSMCAKNYEKLLRVDKVITTNTVCSFFGPLCTSLISLNNSAQIQDRNTE